jgi:hypothetical protein
MKSPVFTPIFVFSAGDWFYFLMFNCWQLLILTPHLPLCPMFRHAEKIPKVCFLLWLWLETQARRFTSLHVGALGLAPPCSQNANSEPVCVFSRYFRSACEARSAAWSFQSWIKVCVLSWCASPPIRLLSETNFGWESILLKSGYNIIVSPTLFFLCSFFFLGGGWGLVEFE